MKLAAKRRQLRRLLTRRGSLQFKGAMVTRCCRAGVGSVVGCLILQLSEESRCFKALESGILTKGIEVPARNVSKPSNSDCRIP